MFLTWRRELHSICWTLKLLDDWQAGADTALSFKRSGKPDAFRIRLLAEGGLGIPRLALRYIAADTFAAPAGRLHHFATGFEK